ncbi:copper resistance CopC family protein [Thalassomonas actiniarum]|uniref:Copper resistance protein CopC n=1 Tax=Thalassomonas actiniarum TaxID=485447 RepID=A0AAF0C3L1_9GAMM|nr:copper resistance CopC family protein [Thalassomonas actiniarum]WDD99055.1 copper resistance protein CopC [Thalassomonas actiniarum]
MKVFKVLTAMILVTVSTLAAAHSGLKASMPANGAMLNHPPQVLSLEFVSDVRLVKLKLTDEAGKTIKLGSKPDKAFSSKFQLPVPDLAVGSYQVNWLAMGKDAHKMTGEFSFMVHSSSKKPATDDGHSNHNHE